MVGIGDTVRQGVTNVHIGQSLEAAGIDGKVRIAVLMDPSLLPGISIRRTIEEIAVSQILGVDRRTIPGGLDATPPPRYPQSGISGGLASFISEPT